MLEPTSLHKKPRTACPAGIVIQGPDTNTWVSLLHVQGMFYSSPAGYKVY